MLKSLATACFKEYEADDDHYTSSADPKGISIMKGLVITSLITIVGVIFIAQGKWSSNQEENDDNCPENSEGGRHLSFQIKDLDKAHNVTCSSAHQHGNTTTTDNGTLISMRSVSSPRTPRICSKTASSHGSSSTSLPPAGSIEHFLSLGGFIRSKSYRKSFTFTSK
jgi:hypothetical protein